MQVEGVLGMEGIDVRAAMIIHLIHRLVHFKMVNTLKKLKLKK